MCEAKLGIGLRGNAKRLRLLLRLFVTLVFFGASTSACGQSPQEDVRPKVLLSEHKVIRSPAAPQSPEAWRAASIEDIRSISDLITNQTMVLFDEANPQYKAWLVQGLRSATERAQEVDGPNSYVDLLTSYVDGFRDPHFYINSRINRPARWPGIIVSLVDRKAIVTFRDDADATLPPMGSVISACDGESIEMLVTKRVFPIAFDPRSVLGQRQAVSRLFLDYEGGLIPSVQACDFQYGAVRWTSRLSWRTLPEPSQNFWWRFTEASAGAPAQFEMTFPVEGVAWIGLPTFLENATTGPKLEGLLNQIRADGAKMRNGRAIVIDLRGNRGGNLELPAKFAEAVFTWPAVRKMVYRGMGTSTDWRASADNLAYVQTLWQSPRTENIAQNMTLALTRREPFWREGRQKTSETSGLTERRPPASRLRPFPAKVYILSDGSCVSACLAFVDIALQVPGTRLIGADTSGDTGYTEIRSEILPSSLTQFSFPVTYVHKRGRGPMEIYKADAAFSGVRDDESVRRWTLDLVMRDD